MATIVWASRLAGTPVPERVPGSDLVQSLPEAAARAGVSVFLLGGNPGVAATAARRLRAGIRGFRASSPTAPRLDSRRTRRAGSDEAAACSAQPTLVLVGLGFPKQEQLIETLRLELPAPGSSGVGISLSFSPGSSPRAPSVMQRLGLEWVHRLLHEPRRLFGRYRASGPPLQPQAVDGRSVDRLVGRP